ncbi:MAG: tetratricopeptide repeat protein [Candidatus Brocadiaceae bacterium]|nr:tetratricopeptide repeat protein [Candidatus Brocadiaceae bacterium]
MTNRKENLLPKSDLHTRRETGNNSYDETVALANTLIDNGKWDEAYPYLKTAVTINAKYAQGFNHLGVYYRKKNNYAGAIENFIKAVLIDYGFLEAHYNLASVYMERKEYDKALSHFKEVVVVNSEDYEVYDHMGQCCLLKDNTDDAEVFFSEALRLNPDYVSAALNLGKVLIKKNECEKAKKMLLRFYRNNITLHEVNFLLGIMYKMEEDYTRAMHHLKETLLIDKNNAFAYNLLGECCVKTGLEEQAETLFAAAIKLDPLNVHVFYNLGNLYYGRKKYQDAILCLEEYVRIKEADDAVNAVWSQAAPSDEAVPLYNLLGNCYKIANNSVKAIEIWEKSLALQPQQQDIKDALADLSQAFRLNKRISLVID